MPLFNVTAAGWSTPRLPEARLRIVELWRAAHGENANTASTSTDGKMIDTLALLLALLWQGLASGNSNAYGRTAEGVFLDLVLDLFARRRREALASTVDVVWYGADATIVLAGSLTSAEDTGARFATDADATIGGDDSIWVIRVDTATPSTLYRITVNGINYDWTTSVGAQTLAGIRNLLLNVIAVAYPDATAPSDLTVDGPLLILPTPPGAVVTTTGPLTRFYAALVPSTAVETGAVVALAGTVRTVVNPQAGVTGVTTFEDADVGRAVETDGEFWSRHLQTLSLNAARSPEAVAARVRELEGVEAATVVENETGLVDADGRPEHSFETYVLGGDDEEIAAVIWAQKPAGIRAYGTTVVETPDSQGALHRVAFTRPTVRYLHLEISVTDGEGYPTTGTPLDTIRAAVAVYFGDGGEAELQLAQDFYRFAVGVPAALSVPGIAALAVRTATTLNPGDPPTFASADVVVAQNEILDVDSSRITMIQL